MNYLAHFFLASDQGNARLGGFLADFVRGDDKQRYSKEIQFEIHMHRLIDAYTDSHPVVLNAKKLVEEKKRRYMGIALDVFYDHKLAQNWNKYSAVSLAEFTQQTYRILQDNHTLLPKNIQEFVPFLIQEDWLTAYKDMQGFAKTIRRLSRRLSKGDMLVNCISDIEEQYAGFSVGFDEFFPELIEYVQAQRTADPS
jgi:acyl carrier protein phosphodiesterase